MPDMPTNLAGIHNSSCITSMVGTRKATGASKSPAKAAASPAKAPAATGGGSKGATAAQKIKVNALVLQFTALHLIVLGAIVLFMPKFIVEFHGDVSSKVSPLESLLERGFGVALIVHGYGLAVASRDGLPAQRKALQLEMLRLLMAIPMVASDSHVWGANPKTGTSMKVWLAIMIASLALHVWACYYH